MGMDEMLRYFNIITRKRENKVFIYNTETFWECFHNLRKKPNIQPIKSTYKIEVKVYIIGTETFIEK